MTSIVLGFTLRPGSQISDEDRVTALRHLDKTWDEQERWAREQILAALACPSLPDEVKADACALYIDSRDRLAALDVTDWESEVPGLTCDDRQNGARAHLDDLAREALYVLKHGEAGE